MDENAEILNLLEQATGDPTLAKLVNGLHRLAATAVAIGAELGPLKAAMERMVPSVEDVPDAGPPEVHT